MPQVPMMSVPKQRVVLPSAGLGERRATPHEFARFEPVVVNGEKSTALIYRCTETGAERRYGLW
jgi:hypothetical protein